jgi:peptide/nickel transport system permease protein
MVIYIVRRTLLAVLTLTVISLATFFIVQLPEGDIVDQYDTLLQGVATDQKNINKVEMREKWGLNDPLIVQWVNWVVPIFTRGDFGTSYTGAVASTEQGYEVREVINQYLPYTIYLSVFTAVITWVFSIPVGIYSAVRQNSVGDYMFTFFGFAGLAVPDFLLGLVAMYVAFAYFDHSVGGIFSGEYLTAPWSVARLIDMLQHLIIPALVLGTSGTAGLIRIMRNNLLDELDKPYVVTAIAKGLPTWRTVIKYPVRVAINPFISGIGGMLPSLVSGSVIISIVLSLPTLGPIFIESVMYQDGPLVSAAVLMFSALSVVGTLISDLLLVVVDPRIRLTGSARGSS